MSEFSTGAQRIEPEAAELRAVRQRSLARVAVSKLSNHDFLDLLSIELARRESHIVGDNLHVIFDSEDGQSYDVQISDHDELYDLPARGQLGFHSDGSPCFDDDRICY